VSVRPRKDSQRPALPTAPLLHVPRPGSEVSAAKQVGGENQAKQNRENAQPAAMRPEDGCAGQMKWTRECSRRMVFGRDRVEIGNCG